MKRTIILSSALCLLGSYSANADISVGINLGEPVYAEPVYENPGYVIAPDYPSYHYDHHRHPHNDYWAHRQHDERAHNEHARANGNHAEEKHAHK
jgi:hypothetical protein